MKIRLKGALLIGSVSAILILCIYALLSNLLMQGFLKLEADHVSDNTRRLIDIFEDQQARIEETTSDYAEWDEDYEYVRGENPSFPESEITDDTLQRLNMDIALITDENGTVLFASAVNRSSGEPLPEYTQAIREEDHSGLLGILRNQHGHIHGAARLGGKTIIFGARFITTTDRSNRTEAMLLFGRFLDTEEISQIEFKTHLDIGIFDASQKPPIDARLDASLLTPDSPMTIITLNDDFIASYFMLSDLNEEPIAIVRNIEARGIYRQGMLTTTLLVGAVIISGIVFFTATLMLLDMLILVRISRLQAELGAVGKTGAMKRVSEDGGDDEITMLRRSINKTIDALDESQRREQQINADLSITNERLREADKTKTEFLNVAAHELKTPLTAIRAYMDILEDYRGDFTKEQNMGLDAIRRNSRRLLDLINNILEHSRIESGHFELNITSIDAAERIRSVAENQRVFAEEKGILVYTDAPEHLLVFADEMRFDEILNNLIGNAIKFTEKGTITVHATSDTDNAIISISDTGIGIPPEKAQMLFSTFYQADTTISRHYEGSGMGLSITKRIVELQHGSVNVKSEPGVGSTFTFTLPLAKNRTEEKS